MNGGQSTVYTTVTAFETLRLYYRKTGDRKPIFVFPHSNRRSEALNILSTFAPDFC